MKNDISLFKIIDITSLTRDESSIKTVNKSCDALSCRMYGESLFLYNDEWYNVKNGEVIFMPSGSSYYQETKGERIIYFHLLADKNFSETMKILKFENILEIQSLFEDACELWKSKCQNYEYKCMSILYTILSKCVNCDEDSGKYPDELKLSLEYINTYVFDVDFSLDKALEKSYVCKTYFYKIFKSYFGCTPTTFINRKRMQRAKHLLISGNYTNDETALLCGIENVKYFYTLFKKMTGYTTKEYIRLEKNTKFFENNV